MGEPGDMLITRALFKKQRKAKYKFKETNMR